MCSYNSFFFPFWAKCSCGSKRAALPHEAILERKCKNWFLKFVVNLIKRVQKKLFFNLCYKNLRHKNIRMWYSLWNLYFWCCQIFLENAKAKNSLGQWNLQSVFYLKHKPQFWILAIICSQLMHKFEKKYPSVGLFPSPN